MFHVQHVAPLSGLRMLMEDVQGGDYVMLDDVNEHVGVAHVCVVVFHIVAILLGQTVVTLDTCAEFFKSFVER